MLALTNGRVFTGRDWVTGVVIADDGTVAGVVPPDSVSTNVPTIDLHSRMVVPGFIDAHLHLSHMAEAGRGLPITGGESPKDLLALVARCVQEVPAGSWILGIGYNDSTWPIGAVDRWALDAVAPRHPVFLERKDLHSGVANSLALQIAEIAEAMADPPGGRFERDALGRLTGVVKERAREAMRGRIPGFRGHELKTRLHEVCRELLQLGVTTVCSIGDEQEFLALRRLQQDGQLPLRVCQYVTEDVLARLGTADLRSGDGDRCWLGGLKLFADGSLGSRTAWLEQAYVGTGDTGIPAMQPAELRAAVRAARDARLAVAIHAIGDRALAVALDAIEGSFEHTPHPHPPPQAGEGQSWRAGAGQPPDRIEHVQLGSPVLFERMRRLEVVASMQPAHAPADRVLAERWWGSRCRHAYAWRSVLAAGVTLAFGSDAPVESADPLQGLQAACTRQDARGEPPGGWYPEQRLSLVDALSAYGPGAATAIGRPHTLGSLAVGAWADLVILEGEPGGGTARVVETYIAGRPVTAP